MGGGSPAPAASTTTQQIGGDELSQLLASTGVNFARGGRGQGEAALEGQGIGNLRRASGAGGLTQAGIGQLKDTIAGKGFAALPGQVDAISQPAIRRLQRSILPSISSEFAGEAGRGSGAEFAAQADAQAGVASEIAATTAGLQTQERDRQFGASQFFPQAQQGFTQAGQAQLQGSNTSQQRNAQLASILPGLRTTTTTGQEQQAGPGKGQDIGSLVGTAAGLYFSGGNPAGGAAGAAAGSKVGGALS